MFRQYRKIEPGEFLVVGGDTAACSHCGVSLTRKDQKKFCSRSCFYKAFNKKRAKPKPACEVCSKPTHRGTAKTCSVECRSRYLERIHKGRTLNTGRTHFKRGQQPANYKGWWRKDSGYIMVHCPDHPHADRHGDVPEHRLVVEENLGRLLTRDEVVHHRNQVKDDNRIENLQVMIEADHLRLHLRERNYNRG